MKLLLLLLLIPYQQVESYHVGGLNHEYRWHSRYEIGYWDDAIHVDLDINLFGYDAPLSKLDQWESGAETFWSRPGYHINLDFVDTDYDYRVYNSPDIKRSNMINWDTDQNWRLVAHEMGHMFGLYDEYFGGAVDPNDPVYDWYGIMGNLGGHSMDRYYAPFDAWLADNSVVYTTPHPTPEPKTILLVLIGGACAVFIRLRNTVRSGLNQSRN